MSDNFQTNTTGRLTPCLQQKIDKTRYFSRGTFNESDSAVVSIRGNMHFYVLAIALISTYN